ncbi:MAG: RNA modification enzyme, MiaB family [Leptospirillum sp. Group II 'C75']|jgi:ribosomal protein S12 methylthiotransferase|uniref:Ribosomal protein uS12 methylthiotransferase RimO n=1 Tax=Leptospirillum ferriphilum (strain ML-04) TaxID=1048260 RepID=J9ZBF6_LEPFM|nr:MULTISPECIES: 30S ribosomal protein S12 methylthiotransferase RimO [Leptospirillum]AFS53810.1 2-methylthioadenine synthetase [Leptospirillum ferriphilum ML-04]EAY55975.1 MAG: RNA modification enzyme, MiaB family [Leptospirillum rubarum]EIJ76275.1 MAG: RNA modification enzyme, MiaB family [Leptospirillum sp. Group II 'C75']
MSRQKRDDSVINIKEEGGLLNPDKGFGDSKGLKAKTVGIVSLGCPKNLVDTETMIHSLSEKGFRVIPDLEEAEVIVVNTCSFVTDARKESIDTLLEMAQYKENGKAKILVGTGCLVSRYREELPGLLPEVDMLLSPSEEVSIGELLSSPESKTSLPSTPLILPSSIPFRRKRLTPNHRAYLKISEGCDHTCSFCAIPLSRGLQVSRTRESLLEEVRMMADEGVREVTLIAQDLTRYGSDLEDGEGLPRLLEEIDRIGRIPWVRLLYAYPTQVTDRLLKVIRDSSTILKYLDIPFQHVSGTVLKRMNRPGNRESTMRLIDRIRRILPDITLRTTFIVGFPGETEEEFLEIEEFLKWSRLDHVGVFPFSREEGTPSFDMDGQIPSRLKTQRRKRLMGVQKAISLEKKKDWLGKVMPVLIEGPSEQSPLILSGRLPGMAPDGIDGEVLVLSGEASPGSIVSCKVKKVHAYDIEVWETSVPEDSDSE